jgi:hypothetical protein
MGRVPVPKPTEVGIVVSDGKSYVIVFQDRHLFETNPEAAVGEAMNRADAQLHHMAQNGSVFADQRGRRHDGQHPYEPGVTGPNFTARSFRLVSEDLIPDRDPAEPNFSTRVVQDAVRRMMSDLAEEFTEGQHRYNQDARIKSHIRWKPGLINDIQDFDS